MTKYGQYCPIAQALEILGDRWTLLIIRDMLSGTQHFNSIRRGLPGISSALLAQRLRHLEQNGIVEKRITNAGRKTTEYHLTEAGRALKAIIHSLLTWGVTWAFDEPSPEQLDPLMLLWWMHERVNVDNLPQERIVIQFNFYGAETVTYWLMLKPDDVTICMTDPGFEINLIITADLATFFKLWLGRIEYDEALYEYNVTVDGLPKFVRDFPNWFTWSLAAPAVRAVRLDNTFQS